MTVDGDRTELPLQGVGEPSEIVIVAMKRRRLQRERKNKKHCVVAAVGVRSDVPSTCVIDSTARRASEKRGGRDDGEQDGSLSQEPAAGLHNFTII